MLNLVTQLQELYEPDKTFDNYCYYFAAFKGDKSKEYDEYYLTNLKIQILCQGDLLNDLKNGF